MCIVRDFEKKKFQIHQNGKLVYSFGDCRTIPTNETCLKKGWRYISKYRYVYSESVNITKFDFGVLLYIVCYYILMEVS